MLHYQHVAQCLSACTCLLLNPFCQQFLGGFLLVAFNLTYPGASVAAPGPGISVLFSLLPGTGAFVTLYSLRKGLLPMPQPPCPLCSTTVVVLSYICSLN